ncbi:MAG: cell division protein ZapA [Deltaproteobacteria bacterium]|nr:cell division protein ZapA [Deltaproteobacteria bacterium]
MEQFITIELLGQKSIYAVDIEVSEAYKIVDCLIKEVTKVERQVTKRHSSLSILTIAALNITEEYLNLKKRHNELFYQISESSAELLKKLNEHDKL